MSFLSELRRRNVFRVVVAYAIVGWLLAQIASVFAPALRLPEWTSTLVAFLLILGFPVAVLLAWAYEMTPDGIKRTKAVPFSQSLRQTTGRKLDFAIIALLVAALGFVAVDHYLIEERSLALEESTAATAQEGNVNEEPTGSSVLPNSIAVLPFTNLSPDPDNAYFAAGIHESLLNQLAKIADLNVIARTSMLRYADGTKSIPEIADELNVQTVMEGSVRYAADRVLVTAQLIDPQTSAHLWSDEYDRPLEDIFSIQTDVAIRIAQALAVEMSVAEQQRIETPATESAAAYQLYLRGRYRWDTTRLQDLRDSVEYFQAALELDANFALAHTGLADALTMIYGIGGPVEELIPPAKAAVERALELDPTLAEAYAARALIRHFYDWEFEAGNRDFERAIELRPNSATAHQYYGKNLSNTFQFADGLAEIERALQLDPYSVGAHKDLGETLYLARRFDEAIMRFERALELQPDFTNAYYFMIRSFEALGLYDQAFASYLELIRAGTEAATGVPQPNELYQASGWSGLWQAEAEALTQRAEDGFVEPYKIVEAHVRAGNFDDAFLWLDRALETHSSWIGIVHIDPLMDPLRPDPRFADLLRRAGLDRWIPNGV